jgi:hypothetical protein
MPTFIRRTKTLRAQDGKVVSTRVHWAVSAAPAGNVTEWADDPRKAREFPDDAALKVLEFYEQKTEDKQPVGLVEMRASTADDPPAK